MMLPSSIPLVTSLSCDLHVTWRREIRNNRFPPRRIFCSHSLKLFQSIDQHFIQTANNSPQSTPSRVPSFGNAVRELGFTAGQVSSWREGVRHIHHEPSQPRRGRI